MKKLKLFFGLILIITINHSVFSQKSQISTANATHDPIKDHGFFYQVEFKCIYELDGNRVKLYVKPIKVYNVSYYHNRYHYRDLKFLAKYSNDYNKPLIDFVNGRLFDIEVTASYNIAQKRISNITWGDNIMLMGNYTIGTELLEREVQEIKNWVNDSRGWGGPNIAIHKIEYNGQEWREKEIEEAFSKYWADEKEKENFTSLMNKVDNTSDLTEKIDLLEKAKNEYKDDQLISEISKQLENLNKKEKEINPDNNKKTNPNNQNSNPTSSEETEISIKKPQEYTQEEWKNLNTEQRNQSIEKMFEEKPSEIEINKELQAQGNAEFAKGNYYAAAYNLNEAGDYSGSLAASATGIVTGIFSDIERSRERNINEKKKNFYDIINKIQQETKIAEEYFNKNDIENLFQKELELMDLRMMALAWINAAYYKTKSATDLEIINKLISSSQNITKYNLDAPLFNDKQKLQIYLNDNFIITSEKSLEYNEKFMKILKSLDLDTQRTLISNALYSYLIFVQTAYLEAKVINNSIFWDSTKWFDSKIVLLLEKIDFDYHFNPKDYNSNFKFSDYRIVAGYGKVNDDHSFAIVLSQLFLYNSARFILDDLINKFKEDGYNKREAYKIIRKEHLNHKKL